MKEKSRKRDFHIMINKEYKNGKVELHPGEFSITANTVDSSRTFNRGFCSAAINTGHKSLARNTGYSSVALCVGYESYAVSVFDKSTAVCTGDESTAEVKGEGSIGIVTGKDSKACGELGCWLVLTERTEYSIKEVKAVRVDGEKIKPNTFYELKNGQIIEAE
jgi:putative uncharacterized protein (fragment)